MNVHNWNWKKLKKQLQQAINCFESEFPYLEDEYTTEINLHTDGGFNIEVRSLQLSGIEKLEDTFDKDGNETGSYMTYENAKEYKVFQMRDWLYKVVIDEPNVESESFGGEEKIEKIKND